MHDRAFRERTSFEPMSWWNFVPKSSVAEQRRRAVRAGRRLAKEEDRKLSPVVIDGRAIARSFWGKSWCDNLESYRDYEYRLPRGRSYVRSGAVLDLDIRPGRVVAVVCGSTLYDVDIKIKAVQPKHWSRIKAQCTGQIGSLIELLEGRLSDQVLRVVTRRDQGLFPKPQEIEMSCSCPDWATMCKHVAAVMYGVGARFDREPQLLFILRKVDHNELIARATDLEVARGRTRRKRLAREDLGSVFGIELDEAPRARPSAAKPHARKAGKPRAATKRRGRRRKAAAIKTVGAP
jgi:uncharacterized Zn finger protein